MSETRLILNSLVWFALLTFAFLYLAKMPDVSRALHHRAARSRCC